MSGLKAIRRRITSVSNTKQITRAMKLVSAAKLRRAQEAALNGRDFSKRLNRIFSDLVGQLPADFENPLIGTREEVKKRRVVAISGERGLCGGFNANIIKAIASEQADTSVETDLVLIGRRSVTVGKRSNWNCAETFEGLSENAAAWPVEEMISSTIADFEEGKCDEVVLVYTTFVSAVRQDVTREVLLPFQPSSNLDAGDSSSEGASSGEMKFEPSAEVIVNNLIPVLIRTSLKQAALESKASEHAARMAAMDSATNNATDLIGRLRLHYNRARQRAITTELIDIVGGAEAVS